MKHFIIICVLAISLICAKSNCDELRNSEESGISLETLKAMLLHTNEMILNIEDDIESVKKQQDKLNSEYTNIKASITSQAKRIKKIEKIESYVKIENISKSFEATLGVLNKNISEMVKRLEDLDVRLAVRENMYANDQNPLETLTKTIQEQKNLVNSMEERLYRQEKISKKLDTSKEVSSVSSLVDTREIAEMKDKKEIKDKIFVKNVELKSQGESTNIVAEIINISDSDYSRVDIKVKTYSKSDTLLDSHDFSVLNLESGVTKKINQLLFGVKKEKIAKYEFLISRRKALSMDEGEERQTSLQKPESSMSKEQKYQIEKMKPVERVKKKLPKKSDDFKKISEDLYIRIITFEKFGSSSIIKGELKNDSRNDISTASFIMKLFGDKGRVITEFDFHISNIKSNTIKPFKEGVSGVLPSQILRYEIKYKKSLKQLFEAN